MEAFRASIYTNDRMKTLICLECGTNEEVIAAPFISNHNKWTIYRANYVEVTFEVIKGNIRLATRELTTIEKIFIQRYIIPNFGNN